MSACSWMSTDDWSACVSSLRLVPCMLPLREWEGVRIPAVDADKCLFTCDRVPAHAEATEGGSGGKREECERGGHNGGGGRKGEGEEMMKKPEGQIKGWGR